MDTIMEYFDSLGLDFWSLLTCGAAIVVGTLLLSLLSRFVFGKKSNLTYALSSAVGIIMMCALIVGLKYAGPQFSGLIAPMPFVQTSEQTLYLFDFTGADYTVICTQLLSCIILAFLFNTVDRWMPKPANIFGWLIFRCLTVIIALALHLFVSALLLRYLPEGLMTYAPVVLLAILILMLLTGALKLLVGILLSTVNPIIGGLYTFFFATIVGKMITRAVFTTGLLALLITALKYLGITAVSIAASVLIVYLPLLLLLMVIWYVINRFL